MAYDVAQGRVVLFGGWDMLGVDLGDTWEYGPVHPAVFQEFGPGCRGTAGIPGLSAIGLPWAGEPFALEATAVPPGQPSLLFVGISRTLWGGIPLPLDLGGLGMPGCFLRVSGELLLAMPSGRVVLPLPAGPGILGSWFYTQALVLDPPANPLGATVSSAWEARVGGK